MCIYIYRYTYTDLDYRYLKNANITKDLCTDGRALADHPWSFEVITLARSNAVLNLKTARANHHSSRPMSC